MSTADLLALGFQANPLPPYFGFCRTCGKSCWFTWFIGRHPYRLDVSACRDCQTVPQRLVADVELAVARHQALEMAEELDEETRELLELKGML